VCGDGKPEGSEPCDDGNQIIGDGCNPFCEAEPTCDTAGASGSVSCTSACGDGIKLAKDAEQCDDGNHKNGDGCDANCNIETGYQCTDVVGSLPNSFQLAVTFRDFIRAPGSAGGTKHPDFETFQGDDATEGMVQDTLGANGKPVYTGKCQQGSANLSDKTKCPYDAQTTTKSNFDQWYG
jgi:cysteine-rich repeat protein